MAIETTVIGSFPKPDYLNVADWFKTGTATGSDAATKCHTELLAKQTSEEKEHLEAEFLRATNDVVQFQHECGVSIVTDGEVRRENYIHYLCRFIDGIDFENLTLTSCRNGAYETALPTIRGKVSWRGPLDVVGEWRKAQDRSPVPVKYTLPGPMTIIGTVQDVFYKNDEALADDLALIINRLVLELAKGGCRHIQVDEPLFARKPKDALDWGVRTLERCFDGVGDECRKTMHMCCGYPDHLDQQDYLKADVSAYFELASAIDESCIDAVSIEDAHRHNDLTLLDHFKKTKVILGVVKVASSEVETVEEIEARIQEALEHIEPERLMIAPDCGLGLLPLPVLKQKLTNMCVAAKRCSCKRARTS